MIRRGRRGSQGLEGDTVLGVMVTVVLWRSSSSKVTYTQPLAGDRNDEEEEEEATKELMRGENRGRRGMGESLSHVGLVL